MVEMDLTLNEKHTWNGSTARDRVYYYYWHEKNVGLVVTRFANDVDIR